LLLEALRAEVVGVAVQCHATNLIQGTAGNVSARDRDSGYIAITPTSVPYHTLEPSDVVVIDPEGRVLDGRLAPSSETPMHAAVYAARHAIGGIVHTHSVFATTFACLGRPIPPVHYLAAVAGGEIPVAEYATYGTPAMGAQALRALGPGRAVLLKHHGVLAVGASVSQAAAVASVVEYVAQVAYQAMLLGTPARLPDSELAVLAQKFVAYGQGGGAR